MKNILQLGLKNDKDEVEQGYLLSKGFCIFFFSQTGSSSTNETLEAVFDRARSFATSLKMSQGLVKRSFSGYHKTSFTLNDRS